MPNRQPGTSAEARPAPEKPQDNAQRPALKGEERERQPKKWDLIDENAWESFPASDAPAHWAGPDLTPEERAARKAQAEKDRQKPS